MFPATEARFVSHAPDQNRQPDSRLPPNPTIGSFAFLANRVSAVRTLSHEQYTGPVKCDEHWLLYQEQISGGHLSFDRLRAINSSGLRSLDRR